jgi:hypothetical protein
MWHYGCPALVSVGGQKRSLSTRVKTRAKTLSILILAEAALSRMRCTDDGGFAPESSRN